MKTRLRSRLSYRIYLAGLAQIAAVVLGFLLLVSLRGAAEREREREARTAAEAVVRCLGDEAALARELEDLRSVRGATLALYDEEGKVLATNRRPEDADPGPMPPPPKRHPPPDDRRYDTRPGGPHHDRSELSPLGSPRSASMVPVRLPDGQGALAVYAPLSPRSSSADALLILAAVLLVVGVASWITARSIARPLAQLAGAARAFGEGKLDTRAALGRSDEIGELASTFDEMADRIAALLRAEKELIANVSHELRTPLTRIRIALDIAAEGDAETAREMLADITSDLSELERLVGDVLTAARLDLGEATAGGIPPLRREVLSVRDLLDQAAARFRAAHPDRALIVATGAELPAVDGDPVLLRRVIDNLLENAHKYSPRPGDEVDLRAEVSGGEIRIEVRDHGIGIAPEHLPNVFQPFYRVDRSRTRATGGLGLGLALARRIVEAHGGSIALTSRVDQGTEARVRFPALHNR